MSTPASIDVVGEVIRRMEPRSLDFAVSYCLARAAGLREGGHAVAARLFDALRAELEAERERREVQP